MIHYIHSTAQIACLPKQNEDGSWTIQATKVSDSDGIIHRLTKTSYSSLQEAEEAILQEQPHTI